jgi:hypothetical protein
MKVSLVGCAFAALFGLGRAAPETSVSSTMAAAMELVGKHREGCCTQKNILRIVKAWAELFNGYDDRVSTAEKLLVPEFKYYSQSDIFLATEIITQEVGEVSSLLTLSRHSR